MLRVVPEKHVFCVGSVDRVVVIDNIVNIDDKCVLNDCMQVI